MGKKVLITGASSGFGKLTVDALLANGHEVVASMRGIEGKNKEAAVALEAAGAKVVELDVTDNASVNAGVAKAIELLGQLDAVVNNAGLGVIGMQEFFTPEDFQKLFDVNVFGVQRVVRAALPHMRANGSGVLVYVTSLLGRVTMPFYGPYNASKWALEAVAENYRSELSAFGIESCVVERGGFATDFFGKLMQPSDQSRNEQYGEFINAPKQLFEGFGSALEQNTEQKPENVAAAILSVIEGEKGKRPFRTVVDKMGMGDAIAPYNEQHEQVTRGILGAFGMGEMLDVK